MCNYRNFDKYIQSCNHYHNHIIQPFYDPKNFLNVHLQPILSLPLQPLTTTNLFSIIIVLLFLEFHVNRAKNVHNIVFCVRFLSLGILLLKFIHIAFEIYSYCCMYQQFGLFYGQLVFCSWLYLSTFTSW